MATIDPMDTLMRARQKASAPAGSSKSPLEQVGQGPEMLVEHWLLHFCEKEEKLQLLGWLREEGLERPRPFDDRVAHAEKLRLMSNEWFGKGDWRRALHCIMGAVHALDWTPAEQMSQSVEQKSQVAHSMLVIMSNAAMIFLKRGDWRNAVVAATAGLKVAGKLPDDDDATKRLRSKLLWRRGIARAEISDVRDLDEAARDLADAAALDPHNRDVRDALANCRKLQREERKNDPIRYRPRGDKPQDASAQDVDGIATAVGDEPPREPRKLSPTAETFAMCVGKCLGRSRRYYRQAKERFGGRSLALAAGALFLAIFIPLLIPASTLAVAVGT